MPDKEAAIGRETWLETAINKYASSGIHLFLSLLAVVAGMASGRMLVP